MLSKERQEKLNQFILSKMRFYILLLTPESKGIINNQKLYLDIARCNGQVLKVDKFRLENRQLKCLLLSVSATSCLTQDAGLGCSMKSK